MRGGPDRRADEPAAYSTDIALAWTIIARMRELERDCLIMSTAESGLVIASFYQGSKDRSDLSATERANEAPMAICRAALKALGVEA